MSKWAWSRWWLVVFLLGATVLSVQAANRYYSARSLYSPEDHGAVSLLTWNSLTGALASSFCSLALAIIAFIPAAWRASRASETPGASGS